MGPYIRYSSVGKNDSLMNYVMAGCAFVAQTKHPIICIVNLIVWYCENDKMTKHYLDA